MKDSKQVITEFNDVVNMTSTDLEKWLKSGDSRSAGWSKEDESGESVGHDSGRKIVEILKSNPQKKPDQYTDDQISHMRKVVSYCKRHLAQESKGNSEKSPEELKKTKSYASLKNWGHDPLKDRGETEEEDQTEEKEEVAEDDANDANDNKIDDQVTDDDDGEDEDEEEYKEEDGDEEEDEEDEKDDANDDKENQKAGAKRKKASNGTSAANKKRETGKGKASTNVKTRSSDKAEDGDDAEDDEYKEDDDADEEDEDADDNEDGGDDQGKSSDKTAKKGPKPGDTVSWKWGNGHPEGKVLEVKGEKTTITTKKGNQVSRNGDPEDPAVVLDTGKSKAIKSSHELD